MKKVIILVAAGILSFVAGTAGIYAVMPSIAPAVVDSTRIRLDSLGLLGQASGDSLSVFGAMDSSISAPFDTLVGAAGGLASDSSESARRDVQAATSLEDSLRKTTNLNRKLQTDNAAITVQLKELTERINDLESQRAEAAELTKSLSTLEERQLGNILSSLDLAVVKMLYLQASARERSRLLQNMPPERAAQFVKALVGAKDTDDFAETETVDAPGEPTADLDANAEPSNQ